MNKEKMVEAIVNKIANKRNVGNEYEGDFFIEEVLIGDVLDYFNIEDVWDLYNNDYDNELGPEDGGRTKFADILELWKDKRLPIEEQSDECIEYIYNLIK